MITHLTPAELAARAKVPVQTLANWRALGKGPAFIKYGRLVRYRLEDVEKWEAKQTEGKK